MTKKGRLALTNPEFDLISDPSAVSRMFLYNLLRKKIADSTTKF